MKPLHYTYISRTYVSLLTLSLISSIIKIIVHRTKNSKKRCKKLIKKNSFLPTNGIKKGSIKKAGAFNVLTQSTKSVPGDGTHGNGVKGGGGGGGGEDLLN